MVISKGIAGSHMRQCLKEDDYEICILYLPLHLQSKRRYDLKNWRIKSSYRLKDAHTGKEELWKEIYNRQRIVHLNRGEKLVKSLLCWHAHRRLWVLILMLRNTLLDVQGAWGGSRRCGAMLGVEGRVIAGGEERLPGQQNWEVRNSMAG